jgi:3-oxoacyl-[acyl-carrier-protein] synthase-3
MMKLRAAITGVGGYIPPDILDNEQLSRMVDTNDEWIMQRIGIKERRILKDKGKATSYMGTKAVKELLKKTHTRPEEVDFLICGTITPDMPFPAVAHLICDKAGLQNAYGYDINAACSGFLYSLETGRRFIESGAYKKVIVVGAGMMSSITIMRTVPPALFLETELERYCSSPPMRLRASWILFYRWMVPVQRVCIWLPEDHLILLHTKR